MGADLEMLNIVGLLPYLEGREPDVVAVSIVRRESMILYEISYSGCFRRHVNAVTLILHSAYYLPAYL